MTDVSKAVENDEYLEQYDPKVLQAVNRDHSRSKIGINVFDLPFKGLDIWNSFDFTWLNIQEAPEYSMLTIYVPCDSTNTIDAKSLKFYLYSFANSQFQSQNEIVKAIEQDLSKLTGSVVSVKLSKQLPEFMQVAAHFTGDNIDNDEVNCSSFALQNDFLQCDPKQIVTEQLCSDLLQTVNPNRGPSRGSVRVSYTGPKIDRSALLKYVISYRTYPATPEHCVEHMYCDILQLCKPTSLTVEINFTRRATLDLNPIRSSTAPQPQNVRLFRQ